jgi:uncharacterized membrane-anchored protein
VKRGLALLLCLAPQFLVVAAMVAREEVGLRRGVQVRLEVGLRRGVQVRLEVRPVDPMSLFAGRYISVPLAISRPDPKHTRFEREFESGNVVYVRLQRAEPFWQAAEVASHPPAEPEAVFLEGVWNERGRIEFGLDTFYIPQDGADPSRLPLTLLVRVSPEGRGQIEDLLVQGRPYAGWNAEQKSR